MLYNAFQSARHSKSARFRGHIVSDIAIFVLKRDVKLQLTNFWGHIYTPCNVCYLYPPDSAFQTASWSVQLVGWLEFNVPFQHKYGYIKDEIGSSVFAQLMAASLHCIRTKEHTNVWLTVYFLLRNLLHGTAYQSNFIAHPLTARFVVILKQFYSQWHFIILAVFR